MTTQETQPTRPVDESVASACSRSPNVDARRDAFIADLVSICRKHRVLIDDDWDDIDDRMESDLPLFTEYHESGVSFGLTIGGAEQAVRKACWNEIRLAHKKAE